MSINRPSEVAVDETRMTIPCRSRATHNLIGFGITLGGVIVLLVISNLGSLAGISLALLGAVIAIWLMDETLTRASIFGFGARGSVTFDQSGVTAPLLPVARYLRQGEGFFVRSSILKRKLGLFDSPNSFIWSELTLLRVEVDGSTPDQYVGSFDFRGPFRLTRGPVRLMGQLRLEIHGSELAVIVRRVLRLHGHVHLGPKLVRRWGLQFRACPVVPGYDPHLGGSCVSGLPPQLVGPAGFGGLSPPVAVHAVERPLDN